MSSTAVLAVWHGLANDAVLFPLWVVRVVGRVLLLAGMRLLVILLRGVCLRVICLRHVLVLLAHLGVGLGIGHEADALVARDGHADGAGVRRRRGRGTSAVLAAIRRRLVTVRRGLGIVIGRSLAVGGTAGPHGFVGAVVVGLGALHLVGLLVRDILLALADAADEPAHAAAKGLDKVPDVHGVKERREAKEAAGVGQADVFDSRAAVGNVGAGVEAARGVGLVGLVGEGPDVEEREDGHFNAEQQGGDADLEIGVSNGLVGMDNVERRGAEGDG